MQLRSFFRAGAVSADPWDSTQNQEEGSLKKLIIPQPGSPTSPVASGELISTAVPADVSAASGEVTSSSIGGSSAGSSSGSASCSPTRATLEAAYQQHTGLTGRQPQVAVADASFEDLCHGGFFTRWTWSNWLVKVNRLTLMIIKQIYLFWLALPFSTPTNHVMVSVCVLVCIIPTRSGLLLLVFGLRTPLHSKSSARPSTCWSLPRHACMHVPLPRHACMHVCCSPHSPSQCAPTLHTSFF